MKARILRELESELEASGLKPGSPAFEKMLRREKVGLCKSMQGYDSCWNCPRFDHCELIKQHLRDIKFSKKEGNAKKP